MAIYTTQASADGHKKVHPMIEELLGKKAVASMFVRVEELRKGGWKDKVKAFIEGLRP